MNDGEIVLPPEVTMKSRARSTRRSAPSRHSPTSPVRSQPSSPLIARVASGVVPVALEQVGTLHQDLAVVGELDLPARGHGADVARAAETGRAGR